MTKYSDNLTVADVDAVLRALPDHEITGDEMCPCQNRRPAPDAVARLVEAALRELVAACEAYPVNIPRADAALDDAHAALAQKGGE